MKKRGKLSFWEEIKTYIRLAMNHSCTKTLEDVVEKLRDIYLVDIRLKGNTISYALPYYRSRNGKPQAVRGSRLGSRFTVAGIRKYMEEKERSRLEFERLTQDIEENHQYVADYDNWRGEAEQPNAAAEEQLEVYEAFDQFLEEKEIPENDEEISVDYKSLSIEERAKLLPPPTENVMEELKAYQSRMGYDADKMKSVRYKMEVYDDFVEEYDYRQKHFGKQQPKKKTERSLVPYTR